MKNRILLSLIAALSLSCCWNSNADDLFQMFWRGTAYVRDSQGNLWKVPFTEQSFINKVARDNGLNPANLFFVYRPDKRDTVVVQGNGAVVADVIQLGLIDTNTGFFDLTNAPDTLVIRQCLLYDEYHQDAIGSAVGGEMPVYSNGALVTTSFSGAFQFAYPENNAIYYGTFSTGRRITDTSGN